MTKRVNRIQQFLIGPSMVANGDFSLDLKGKITGIRVKNLITSGFNVVIGWNDSSKKDVIIPGQSEPYGIEGEYINGVIYINFDPVGAGEKSAVLTIWTETNEMC